MLILALLGRLLSPQNAQLLWTWGGWGSGYEYAAVTNTPSAFANIQRLLTWSGERNGWVAQGA